MTTDAPPITLTSFLLARIAEDEAVARAIPAGVHEDAVSTSRRYDHVFRWSPARVLAECEAKRRIVEEMGRLAGDYRPTSTLDEDGWILLCWETLETLAAVYADHPDYRDEWRA